MAYFEYFSNILSSKLPDNEDEIKGTCNSFCPKEEEEMREREKMVHVLEVLGDTRTLVKSYSRSAADSNMAKPHLLRPYTILKDTLEHLLLDVSRRADVPTAVLYDFINDRLRAIRQDMTIQRLQPHQSAELLEPMVRFYVYYGFKLSDAPPNDFDPVLNKKYLLECLKLYLSCCQNTDNLHNMFSSLNINKRHELRNDRVLMESLYILSNLDDVHPIMRYLTLDKELRRTTLLRVSRDIAAHCAAGHFVQATRLAERLPPLPYCAFCMHLPVLQRRSLRTLSHAYHSARLAVPLSALCRWLHYDGAAAAGGACAHYGLNVIGDSVTFIKGGFREDVGLLKTKKIASEKLQLNLIEMLTQKIIN